jgi:thiamine-phosphate pyrophosphorylase
MKFILISSEKEFPNETSIVTQLFKNGLETFHLRKPDFSLDETKKFLDSIPSEYHNRIVLHGYRQLPFDYKVKGLHFSFGKIKEENFKCCTSLTFSGSAHSIEEIKNSNPILHYVFLSPVFNSISKAGYESKINLKEAESFLSQEIKRPEVIALGGVDIDKIEKITNTRFDGFAMLGAFWNLNKENDIFAKFESVNKILNSPKVHA